MKKILVCAAILPDTLAIARLKGNQLICDNNSLIINPLDELCVNRSVQIREQRNGDAEITVVSVGTEKIEEALRKAAALGASRIVRINAEPRDAWSVAAELADFALKDRFDLILCGYQSWDYSFGLVPGYLAERMRLPLIESCLAVGLKGDAVLARRETADGYEEIESDGPVIAACKKNIVAQRDVKIPTFRAMMMSKNFPVEVIPPAGEQPRLSVNGLVKPAQRNKVKFISVEELAGLIRREMEKESDGKREDHLHPVYAGQWLMDYNYGQMTPTVIAANDRLKIIARYTEPEHIGLGNAKIILSGGMGMGSPDNWVCLEEFSRIAKAALACTKPVYDRGWRPYYEHVGQTGSKVSPDLYIAAGISGALQHVAGMFRSKTIAAVNTDLAAPIFKEADYGIIGDAPQIIGDLNRILSAHK